MSDGLPPDRHRGGADNGEEVAAYALGALEPAEADAFARHLESCAICRDELEAFRGVVELLPLSVDAHSAPRLLRRRVLREVRAAAAQADLPLGARADTSRQARGPLGARRWSLSLAGAVAAILLVVAGLGGFSGSGVTQRTIHAQVIGPGQASLRIGGGRAELVVAGLPAPPAGKIYEVWLAHRRGPAVATEALFGVDRAGRGDVMVPGDMHGVVEVMVTPEPAGGSRQPTHPPVIVARI